MQGLCRVVHISARLWLSVHKTLIHNIRTCISQGSAATRIRCGGSKLQIVRRV